MEQFFIQLFKTTALQIIGLFGIFFIFDLILSNLQRWIQKNYQKTVGWQGILWTAWLGTPFHEFGHWFFAKLFRHKTSRLALFQPDQETGELGRFDHYYNAKSLYQSIGNFFIGAGPMIFGSIILVLMLYFLVPNGPIIFDSLSFTKISITNITSGIWRVLSQLFTLANLKTWNFWLFLYISFCIASHLAPSKKDWQGIWGGLFTITGILLFFNIFAWLINFDFTQYLLKTANGLNILMVIFTYATIISFSHFILSAMVLRLISLLKK